MSLAIGRSSGVATNGPTVLRIGLGARLRHKREVAGLTTRRGGRRTSGALPPRSAGLELGRVGFKERDVTDLLTRYGVVEPDERAEFLALVARANAPAGGTATPICCPPGSRPTSAWSRPRR